MVAGLRRSVANIDYGLQRPRIVARWFRCWRWFRRVAYVTLYFVASLCAVVVDAVAAGPDPKRKRDDCQPCDIQQLDSHHALHPPRDWIAITTAHPCADVARQHATAPTATAATPANSGLARHTRRALGSVLLLGALLVLIALKSAWRIQWALLSGARLAHPRTHALPSNVGITMSISVAIKRWQRAGPS